ncbi:MAG: RluA family pseudouridine synthase [Candidatus Omnitrophica bacterium]|nr:RluA family pseudouridine synthase [Candidatus Omnitrophota bacterium]MDD5429250.1 RluA family pseudouridine synthase [Candidatus Omnitrophota bacterium]
MKKELIVSTDSQGMRLDKFLAKNLENISRSKINAIISGEGVVVDGVKRKPSFSLKPGQRIEIAFLQEDNQLKPFKRKINILYEDEDIIVLFKPSGLVVHPPQEHYYKTLVNALIYLKKQLSCRGSLRPGVVHRLDKETSGVMVLAKNDYSHNSLIEQFKSRKVKKEYVACVWGKIEKDKFDIDLPLSRDSKNRLKMRVSFLSSKKAYTKVEVLRRMEGAAYLLLRPATGRMHQLRVHLKFMGYPIVGDKKYGVKDDSKELLLHAKTLSFYHPRNKELIKFSVPVPERFDAFIREHI